MVRRGVLLRWLTRTGIGKKIVPAARQVLEALNLDMQFVELSAGTH